MFLIRISHIFPWKTSVYTRFPIYFLIFWGIFLALDYQRVALRLWTWAAWAAWAAARAGRFSWDFVDDTGWIWDEYRVFMGFHGACVLVLCKNASDNGKWLGEINDKWWRTMGFAQHSEEARWNYPTASLHPQPQSQHHCACINHLLGDRWAADWASLSARRSHDSFLFQSGNKNPLILAENSSKAIVDPASPILPYFYGDFNHQSIWVVYDKLDQVSRLLGA